ncbi:MAG: hypothetical protein IJ943_05290 [Akkermansia sp.]|nr:hypothetical protein [Akkermansia sp.]
MKQFFGTVGCCLSLACAVSALEVGDLPVEGLTRDYADNNFSKDYEYCILSDYSVRRTWKAEGYTLTLDFDIRSGKLLSLYVDYEPAAPKAEAMRHMRHLCEGRDEDTKWVKTKEKSANNVGLHNARHRQLTDKSFLFWESAGSSGDCERLCWFAEAPRQDRMKIAHATKNTGKTAMGTSSAGGGFEAMFKDEARRRGLPATDTPSEPAKMTPAPEQGSKPAADSPSQSRGEQVKVNNPLEKLGMEWNDETKKWLMYIGGALLVLIIWSRIAAARRRARQTAAFEELLRRDDRGHDGKN